MQHFALIQFLHSDEADIGPETVMTTLYTAKKYFVAYLEKACVKFIKKLWISVMTMLSCFLHR